MQLAISTASLYLTQVYTLVCFTPKLAPMTAFVHPAAATVQTEDHVFATFPTHRAGEEFGQVDEQSAVEAPPFSNCYVPLGALPEAVVRFGLVPLGTGRMVTRDVNIAHISVNGGR